MIESVLQYSKICLPCIAIGFLILALLIHKRVISAPSWIFIAGYCYINATEYLALDESFDASLALVVLALSLILAFIMLRPTLSERREEDSLYSLTKIVLIAAVFYFPFAQTQMSVLGDSFIFITAKITTIVLNLFNVGVYLVPPSYIYTTDSSFHAIYQPIEIILACTAIQGMVLFIGLIFGVKAPIRRKLKAFFVSVPVIYVLNILRNVFVTVAYFDSWFGPPPESFFIAHGVIARIAALIALIAIAYAVFKILPEALDFVEDFFAALKSSFRVHKAI